MSRHRFVTRDGLIMRRFSRVWRWWRRNHRRLEGSNPAPIHGSQKPPHHPLPPGRPAHKAKSFGQHVVALANESLQFAGKMVYSESADRSELFSRKPGDFNGAHADCSQYCSSILHWLGVKSVNQWDYTGTLLQKGRPIAKPKLGCVVIWGPGTGAHAAFYTGNGMTVGFGHQGAPDRVSLTDMNAYFVSVGEPGVRYLDFQP